MPHIINLDNILEKIISLIDIRCHSWTGLTEESEVTILNSRFMNTYQSCIIYHGDRKIAVDKY